MVSVEELRKENDEIVELCTILSTVVENVELLGNSVYQELLQRFRYKVRDHLAHEDRSVYQDMVANGDQASRRVASQFMGNTHELKRLFAGYDRRWRRGRAPDGDRDAYVDDTKELFRLVCARVKLESEKLFPLLVGS